MYRLISLAFVMSCTSAANAQLHIKPQTPTPTPLIREAFMPKGDVLLSYPKDDILDEKPIWHWGYHQRKLNELVITNALGEKLTEKEIRKTLEKPTIVLISADGKPVHPYYLKVIRPDTLVIIDKTPIPEAPDREPVKQRTLKVDPEKRETPKKNLGGLQVSETNAVYAKVILAVKALDDGDQPLLESWIAKELRKRGATDLRAVTDWVRLTDGGDSTSVWEAKLDGKLSGCPVDGQVGERTADGKVQVTLSGWSPFGANVRGNTLPDEIGSRGIAIVDPGRADEVESYVALMIAPALQTNAAGERDSARQPVTAPESKTEDKQKPKPESKQSFARGPHLLHTTFDEKDPRWNFNHDVNVRAKGEQLTLIVLDDLNKQDQEAGKPDSKPVQGGFGNPSKDDTAKSSEPRSEQEPLLSAKQQLHGIVDSEGEMQFGVTTIRDGKLISLHFVGRLSLGGASGKVYLLSSKEPVREGAWYLKNPFSRGGAVPGFNGTNPFGR